MTTPVSSDAEVAELLRKLNGLSGSTNQMENSVVITPSPCFIISCLCSGISTTDVKPRSFDSQLPQGFGVNNTVYINVASHESIAPMRRIPAGPGEEEGFSIPIAVGPLKGDVDEQSSPAIVVDAVVNPMVIQDAELDESGSFKHWLCNLAMQYIDRKHNVSLSPQYKLPNMKYKGEVVSSQRIRSQKPVGISEIRNSTVDNSRTDVFNALKENHSLGSTAASHGRADIDSNVTFSRSVEKMDMLIVGKDDTSLNELKTAIAKSADSASDVRDSNAPASSAPYILGKSSEKTSDGTLRAVESRIVKSEIIPVVTASFFSLENGSEKSIFCGLVASTVSTNSSKPSTTPITHLVLDANGVLNQLRSELTTSNLFVRLSICYPAAYYKDSESAHTIHPETFSISSSDKSITIKVRNGATLKISLPFGFTPISVLPSSNPNTKEEPVWLGARFSTRTNFLTIQVRVIDDLCKKSIEFDPVYFSTLSPDDATEYLSNFTPMKSVLEPDRGSKIWLMNSAFADGESESIPTDNSKPKQESLVDGDLPEDLFHRGDALSMYYLQQREEARIKAIEKDKEREKERAARLGADDVDKNGVIRDVYSVGSSGELIPDTPADFKRDIGLKDDRIIQSSTTLAQTDSQSNSDILFDLM